MQLLGKRKTDTESEGLPEGFDDPKSPLFIPENARPFYDPAQHVTRDEISRQLVRIARDESRARQLAWFEAGDAIEDREQRREFRNRHSHYRLDNGEFEWRFDFRDPAARANSPQRSRIPDHLLIQPLNDPTHDQLLLAAHRVRLAPALEAAARQRREAEARALWSRRHTCTACGDVDQGVRLRPDIAPDGHAFGGKAPKVCPSCADDIPLLDGLAQLGKVLADPDERASAERLTAQLAQQLPSFAPVSRLLADHARQSMLARFWAEYIDRCLAHRRAVVENPTPPPSWSPIYDVGPSGVAPDSSWISPSTRRR